MTGSLWRRFEQTAKTFSDRIALVHGEARWTFTDLHARARAIAGTLRSMGVGRAENIIGIPRLGVVGCEEFTKHHDENKYP